MPFVIQDILVHLPTEPFLYQGTHFAALTEIVKELGGDVSVDQIAARATATIAPWTARIQAGLAETTVEGMGHTVTVPLSAPPYLQVAEMFVPVDLLHDLFGYTVTVDGQTVTIVNPSAT